MLYCLDAAIAGLHEILASYSARLTPVQHQGVASCCAHLEALAAAIDAPAATDAPSPQAPTDPEGR
jgi:hypothetical protein